MKGYKVFRPDWTCRGFQYEVGKTYRHEGKLEICESGFHFCERCSSCFNYYDFDPKNKVAVVEATGRIIRGDDSGKFVTDEIAILREVSWEEVLDVCNTGNDNAGYGNTGDHNAGNWNSGDHNAGNWNSGDCNSGNSNSGDRNSGDHNSGCHNFGDYNTGDNNMRDWNTGNLNSGNCNSGDNNSGDRNSGDHNSGSWNSGYWNSGDHNSGNWNSGDWNSGFFNTCRPTVRMFNKDTGLKRGEIFFPDFLYFDTNIWVSRDTATDEEKCEHKTELEKYGCFLKRLEYKEAFRRAWQNASGEDRELIKKLPNFDADIFYEISGIRI